MLKRRLQIVIATVMLVVTVLSLGGCRRVDTMTDKQALPLVGGDTSPLPTPGAADSPVTP
jgi:hypothetical protein